eukprot:CAMPEP_0206825032 /NCGR_PEP_ID=MMETSP0975-20121206/14136_1 /ASSEMBLY_ACC=CAM_ASM_000399 /TAXON_ID=483370 /ORGANISM="non described non described, Strain CCMP2097" /LENGTH=133 /DNA_ID=CAMNT_0054367317 /DNA_START=193 /DNA_END=590 /DNA_ORIENTATION=+
MINVLLADFDLADFGGEARDDGEALEAMVSEELRDFCSPAGRVRDVVVLQEAEDARLRDLGRTVVRADFVDVVRLHDPVLPTQHAFPSFERPVGRPVLRDDDRRDARLVVQMPRNRFDVGLVVEAQDDRSDGA